MRALALVACIALPALAQEEPPRAVGASTFASRDSDGLRIDRAGAGAYLRYRREGDATGIVAENARYTQGPWGRSLEAVTLVHRETDRRTAEGLRLALTLSRQKGRGLVGGDIDWNRELVTGTRVGLVLARDWVETREALDAGVHATIAGASIDRSLGPFTIVGFAAGQRFSDGNHRRHLRARFIAPVAEAWGVTAQLRYRGFVSEDIGVPRRYFNPERYDQVLAVLAMRKRFEPGVTFLGEGGYGRQHVRGDGTSPSWLVHLAIGKVFPGGAAVRLDWQHTRAASLAGPGYRYRALGFQAELPL